MLFFYLFVTTCSYDRWGIWGSGGAQFRDYSNRKIKLYLGLIWVQQLLYSQIMQKENMFPTCIYFLLFVPFLFIIVWFIFTIPQKFMYYEKLLGSPSQVASMSVFGIRSWCSISVYFLLMYFVQACIKCFCIRTPVSHYTWLHDQPQTFRLGQVQ